MVTEHFRMDFSKAAWNGMRAHLAHPNTPVAGGTPAISCSYMKDSHQFCAVPAAAALLPSYNTDYYIDKGRDLGEAEGLTLLQVTILPAAEVEHTASVCSFQGHYSLPRAGSRMSLGCPRRLGVHLPHWPRGERCSCTFQFSNHHIFILSAQSSRLFKGITLPSLGLKAEFNEFDEPV